MKIMTLLSGELLSVPAGIEPATPRLTVVCSNQLSYGTSFISGCFLLIFNILAEYILLMLPEGLEPSASAL